MTLAMIFVAIWLLGAVASFTLGGLIHVLPVVALGIVLPRAILGRSLTDL